MLFAARRLCPPLLLAGASKMAAPRPSSNMAAFRETLAAAKHVVVLTGAGVSAESGVPTFRGAGGWWRRYQAQNLATPGAFREQSSLVWEFYHYRRHNMASKQPNKAHEAIASLQQRWTAAGRRCRVITQNIDGLHQRAGSQDVLELHGTLFKTRCTRCRHVEENRDDPICPALAGTGAPDPNTPSAHIPVKDLPRCRQPGCGGLLRPHVVWFGENLDAEVLDQAEAELEACDLCLVVGTSSVVYPAAMFAPSVAERGVPVAEFNLEPTPKTAEFGDPASNSDTALSSLSPLSADSSDSGRASVSPGPASVSPAATVRPPAEETSGAAPGGAADQPAAETDNDVAPTAAEGEGGAAQGGEVTGEEPPAAAGLTEEAAGEPTPDPTSAPTPGPSEAADPTEHTTVGSHSSDSLTPEEAASDDSWDAPLTEADLDGDTLSTVRRDSEVHELLEPLDSDIVDPADGLKVLDDLFTSGKINEVQYKDLQRKHKYLQSMFWSCIQNRAGLREDILETNAFLKELKAKAREEAGNEQRDNADDISDIQTMADLEGKNVDELKRYLASFTQQRKTLENSIYQIQFKTRHMEEERQNLQERVDSTNLSSSKIYLNSPAMLEKDIRELGVEIRVRKQEVRNLLEDINTRERTIPQRETKIAKLEEKLQALQEEKEELLPKMVLVSRDADREEKHTAKLRKQSDSLSQTVSTIIGQLKETTDAAQKVDNERNELIKVMDREYKLLDAKSKECTALTRDTERCRERAALLMEEKNRTDSRLAMLASEMRQQNNALRDAHKAVERVERDLRSAEESLRVQRSQMGVERSEVEKLQREMQLQTRATAEIPAQRYALQRDVDAAHRETNVLNSLTLNEQQSIDKLAKERGTLLRTQETLTKTLEALGREYNNLIRQRDTNARVFRKLSGEVERNEDEMRNRFTVVAKFRKKCEETEKQTKQLAERYELAKKERDEMSAQLNISLTNCDELMKKTEILRSQQDTMLSRKLELERQHDVTRQTTIKTILDKTMIQSTMNQEKDAMKELEAHADQLDMMIGCCQMSLNAIKESIMSDLEEYKRQVVDRNERGLLLVERDEEVCAFQEKIALQQLFVERGYARLDTAEKDMVELNKIIRTERHHIQCLGAQEREMQAMSAQLADTRCQLRQLNSRTVTATAHLETPARRDCRLLPAPAAGDGDVPRHLRRIELQLYGAELRLLERQMIAAQVGRLADRARHEIDTNRADCERMVKRASAGRRAVKANSRRLMASAAEASVAKTEARRLCEERARLEAQLEEARRRVAAGLPPEQALGGRQAPGVRPPPTAQPPLPPPPGPTPRPTQYMPEAESSLPLPRPYGAFSPFKPQAKGSSFMRLQKMASRGQKQ
ncbi:NAD-dependent protein deacylase sirtuin-5, mitochondrial [Amphibalanus amphitrite]|uniref:NAD-dependent protein deacylase n=1 Tax=Amphibalanus amphitrite TaxID=1232801 RepID=A0A6A4VKB0_AMPAM|nr:NAD-dependent protein deacylase sirtuin-5, mitochondrial [Amphibalanus amphitrite]